MLIKWIQSVFFGVGRSSTSVRRHGSKTEKGRLLDVIHEAVKSEASEFAHLMKQGMPGSQYAKRRAEVKQKVCQAIDPSLNDEAVVEEITDRITDAAAVDPYYQRLFTDDAAK